jgi:transcriptional regulator with XRE-family HTH domain
MPVSVCSRCEHVFVRRKDEAQREARRLRERGWSLGRIARELGVAKSSVSVWVRGLASPPAAAMLGEPLRALTSRKLPVWTSRELRRCGRCGYHLPTECFNRLGAGRQWWCRTCFAAYFRARGDLHRRQSNTAKLARTQALREYVLEHLLRTRCTDCGERDPVVLEFDHIGEKVAHVARLLSDGASKKAVDAEIARCEVVCANCHRRRTARRGRWRRGDSNASTRACVNRRVDRNVAHVLDVLRRHPCVDCGERDPIVLEFDHIGPKRALVTRLAWDGRSIATIDAEIRECEVRCANCHRRMTAKRAGHYRFRVLSSAAPP